jgi:hypothetical protein
VSSTVVASPGGALLPSGVTPLDVPVSGEEDAPASFASFAFASSSLDPHPTTLAAVTLVQSKAKGIEALIAISAGQRARRSA